MNYDNDSVMVVIIFGQWYLHFSVDFFPLCSCSHSSCFIIVMLIQVIVILCVCVCVCVCMRACACMYASGVSVYAFSPRAYVHVNYACVPRGVMSQLL